MKVDSFQIAQVFSNGGDIHFRLPYFQREYAWNLENWKILLEDILDLYTIYSDENPPEHFLGSLVVINEGTIRGTIPLFKLVDGQQRLTTISLILCALSNIIKGTNPSLYQSIRRYITNPAEEDDVYFKLLPTAKHEDRITYCSILKDEQDILVNGSKMLPAYRYYFNELQARIENHSIDPKQLFLAIINSLQVVFINLSSNEKPYQIFESLNAKGKHLTQADLVRNYIAMKLPESRQKEVFEGSWSKVENLFQEETTVGHSRLGELTAFIRHYLAYQNSTLCNEEHVYARFRDRIETYCTTTELFIEEIKNLKVFAVYYDRFLHPEKETVPEVKNFLERLKILEVSTCYPFLLALFNAREKTTISNELLVESLSLFENYIIRRYLAGEPTNYLNKALPTLWKDIDIERFIESLKEALSSRNYPTDAKLRNRLETRSMYDNSAVTRTKTILVLETINRLLSERRRDDIIQVLRSDPSIEHIMPQTLSEQWKQDLGENYAQVYDQYLNTIGNLTLVTAPWNAGLSNDSFSIKKPNLARHGLLLNKSYFEQSDLVWDLTAIKTRTSYLTDLILQIWPALGEPPAPPNTAGSYPIRLICLGETRPVASWRDVSQQTTEVVLNQINNFEELAAVFTSYLSKNPYSHANRLLTNGWNLNTNLSANAHRSYCRHLLERAGFSLNDWHVELSQG